MASSLRLATACIAVAIAIVLCIHWHLVFQHLHSSLDLPSTDPSLALAAFHRDDSRRTKGSDDSLLNKMDSFNDTTTKADELYILSPICGGCFRSKTSGNKYCYDLIDDQQRKDPIISLSYAANKVGRSNQDCKLCIKDYCLESHFNKDEKQPILSSGYKTIYWRFDKSGPKFTNPQSLALPSIPRNLRIPSSRFDDVDVYFQEMYNTTKSKSAITFLVEYNPGLVAIPLDMKQYLPPEATYLLSLRVTPANNCFPTSIYAKLPKDTWSAVYQTVTNHLGLALLDESYQFIPGYDVVIDVGQDLDLRRPAHKWDGPNFMDYRLFVLNNEIVLHTNAETVSVTKLILKAKGYGNNGFGINTSSLDREERMNNPYTLRNIHGGDNLQVATMRQFNTIWTGGVYGKNYALFAIPNATHPDAPDAIYAEIDITPHHKVQQILPDKYNQLVQQTVFERIWKVGTHKGRRADIDKVNMREVKQVGNITESNEAPMPSFSTVDEINFPGKDAPFKESAHGGACCVLFTLADLNLGGRKSNHNEPLLVGIAHTRVSWRPWYNRKNVPQEKKDRVPHTHYVSFIYAFDPYPPFHIRARSGYFCLGHAPLSSESEELHPSEGGVFNPHSVLTRNRMLQQNNETFDCPQVHYISSFIENARDSSKTIMGYGLNDCTGRLIEVEKREIVRLLYPDPMDMLFEIE